MRIKILLLFSLLLINFNLTCFAEESTYCYPIYTNNASFLNTSWGFGPRENKYNYIIMSSIQNYWDDDVFPLSPLLLKAIIAVESSFKSDAVSYAGHTGLMQLGANEAMQQGLSLNPDERFIPEKNIKAAIGILKIKHNVIINPLDLYHDEIWAIRVNDFYLSCGFPDIYQQWVLTLAAYNGGGATVLRAMSYAVKNGKDPRVWQNLYYSQTYKNAPLYYAIKEVYGSTYAVEKYYQMGEYPFKILKYYKL